MESADYRQNAPMQGYIGKVEDCQVFDYGRKVIIIFFSIRGMEKIGLLFKMTDRVISNVAAVQN